MAEWIPEDPDIPIRPISGFTIKDIARVGIPTTLAYSTTYLTNQPIHIVIAATTIAVAIGLFLAKYRVGDDAVDTLLLKAALTAVGLRTNNWNHSRSTGHTTAVLNDGTVLGAVHVKPFNIKRKPAAEQDAITSKYQQLFQTITFPVKIHSESTTTDLEPYSCPEDSAITTRHVVTVRVTPAEADTVAARKQECRSRVETVTAALNSGMMDAQALNGNQLQRYIESRGENVVSGGFTNYRSRRGYTVHPFYISDYPEELPTGWLSEIAATDGYVDIVQTIEPVDDVSFIDDLLNQLQVQSALDVARGDFLSGDTSEKSLNQWRELLQRGEQVVRAGVYIYVRGRDTRQLESTVEVVRNQLRSLQIDFTEPRLQAVAAEQTRSPYYPDMLENMRLMPAQSIAGAFPFTVEEVVQDGGVYTGRDTRTGKPIVLNRFEWDVATTARFGHPGSGKSYAEKLEILRSYRRHDELPIYIIDPKPEYGPVVDALDGDHLDVTDDIPDDPPADVLRIHVPDTDHSYREELADAVATVYTWLEQDDAPAKVVIDEAHRLFKAENGEHVLSRIVREVRDKNTAVTILTQNVDDFLGRPEGRKMLRNIPGIYLHRHSDTAHDVGGFFNLSQQQDAMLKYLDTGNEKDTSEAILRVDGTIDTVIRVRGTEAERRALWNGEPLPDPDEEDEDFNRELPNADDYFDTDGSERSDPADGDEKEGDRENPQTGETPNTGMDDTTPPFADDYFDNRPAAGTTDNAENTAPPPSFTRKTEQVSDYHPEAIFRPFNDDRYNAALFISIGIIILGFTATSIIHFNLQMNRAISLPRALFKAVVYTSPFVGGGAIFHALKLYFEEVDHDQTPSIKDPPERSNQRPPSPERPTPPPDINIARLLNTIHTLIPFTLGFGREPHHPFLKLCIGATLLISPWVLPLSNATIIHPAIDPVARITLLLIWVVGFLWTASSLATITEPTPTDVDRK